MATSNKAGRQIAWNGVAFTVPHSWHPAVILKDYLLFEEEYAPVFEIKWQKPTRSFSATSVLNRLSKMLPSTSIAPWQPPNEWTQLLEAWTVYGFTWNNDDGGGNGLLLSQPQEGMISLLRFHGFITDPPPNETLLLDSLRFMDDAETFTWQIFDISASIPRQAVLQSHQFLTGKYTLGFTLDTCSFTLFRFKPAAELLNNTTLEGFGLRYADLCVPATGTDECRQWRYQARGLHRLLDRLRRRPTNIDMQLKWFKEQNTILGIRVQGNGTETTRLLERLSPHYLPVPQKLEDPGQQQGDQCL